MGRIGSFARIALAGLLVALVLTWAGPADAHAGHPAHPGHQLTKTAPSMPGTVVAKALSTFEQQDDGDCALACCVGGMTCAAHVAGPPVSAPALPDPGSATFVPTLVRGLSGIPGERLPRPPRVVA